MKPFVRAAVQTPRRTSLYRRPSRLRRAGMVMVGAGGALAVACGGGGDSNSPPDAADVWVESDGAQGRLNMDDVKQVYRDSYKGESGFSAEEFERRVNEIYEGDNIVLVQIEREGENYVVSGWEDLNGNKGLDPNEDDRLFSITQQPDGNYETRGHGANGYYYNSSPFGGFFTGLLIGNLLSGGFGGRNTYVTTPARYDDLRSTRDTFRQSPGFESQRQRNGSYGASVGSRFGDAANTQRVSPQRSSYQQRQINSGAIRSTGSGSRSIGSGGRSGTTGVSGGTSGGGSGGVSGGGGLMAL